VYPVSSLASGIPWLPLEEGEEPMTVYYGFNAEKPPFNVHLYAKPSPPQLTEGRLQKKPRSSVSGASILQYP
jgi:hypothetical protein